MAETGSDVSAKPEERHEIWKIWPFKEREVFFRMARVVLYVLFIFGNVKWQGQGDYGIIFECGTI